MKAPPYEMTATFGRTVQTGVYRGKREAIRECRRVVREMPVGTAGAVRREGFGLVYQCHSVEQGGRVRLHVEEL